MADTFLSGVILYDLMRGLDILAVFCYTTLNANFGVKLHLKFNEEVKKMGRDLTLLPMRDPREVGEVSVLAYNRLSFDRDYELFGQITEIKIGGSEPTIKPLAIPPQMWVTIYGDEGLDRTRTDKYGTELTFVYAKELKKLKLPEDVSARNRAIKAFIDALPDDTPIILWWS